MSAQSELLAIRGLLAIGCGAHGKLTFPDGDILRFSKTKHPKGYLRGEYLYEEKKRGKK